MESVDAFVHGVAEAFAQNCGAFEDGERLTRVTLRYSRLRGNGNETVDSHVLDTISRERGIELTVARGMAQRLDDIIVMGVSNILVELIACVGNNCGNKRTFCFLFAFRGV